jgi:hypothetical protein
MAQRRFGPVQGAGTQIIEKDAEKAIIPSSTGCTVETGVYERGTVGDLNYCPKKSNFLKRMGERLTNGYLAPDSCIDFYDTSEGAGELYCLRITDGNETCAEEYFYNRRVPSSIAFKLYAANGGRWGGKRGFIVGTWATTGTDLTETTLATGKTMLKNYWAGATLRLKTVSTKSYVVLSNTVDGVITVVSDATMKTDYGAGTNKEYTLTLENEEKYLAAYVSDGTNQPTEEWALKVYCNGVLEYEKDNMSSNPTSPRYFVRAINDDTSNNSVRVTDLWTGGYAADVRPANHFEQLVSLTDTVAKIEIMQVAVNSAGGGNATVGAFVYGQSLKAQKLTLTFASATTYNVVSDKFGALNAAPVNLGVEFESDFGEDYMPKFVVTAGAAAMAEDDTITILVRPFVPDELIGGFIFPDKAGDRRKFYQIVDNTVDTVTVKTDSDMLSSASAGTKATQTGTLAGPFDTSTSHTFKLIVDGGIEVTVSLTQGATTPAATIASEINAAVGATVATVDPTSHIKLTSTVGGRFSKLKVSNGDANTILGFTDNTTVTGVAGDAAMLQWQQQLHGGYDGLADLTDSDFEAAYDIDSSPIRKLYGRKVGLVKLGTPGVTSTSVQKKGVAFAGSVNYQYRYEIPSNITTEDAAETYINDTLGRNDFAVVAFPSFGYIANPAKNSEGFKLVSLTGAIHGREAKIARDYGGYHKAAAGVDVTLPGVLKLPTGENALDEELLNPQGIQVIKFLDGNCIVWGDRTVSVDPQWRWKHQREQMSFYENTLRENFDWIVFAINDPETWGLAWTALDKYFGEQQNNRALRGYTLKIDSENNTQVTMGNGDLNAEIRLQLPDTVEKFKITMSKLGIFEDVGA